MTKITIKMGALSLIALLIAGSRIIFATSATASGGGAARGLPGKPVLSVTQLSPFMTATDGIMNSIEPQAASMDIVNKNIPKHQILHENSGEMARALINYVQDAHKNSFDNQLAVISFAQLALLPDEQFARRFQAFEDMNDGYRGLLKDAVSTTDVSRAKRAGQLLLHLRDHLRGNDSDSHTLGLALVKLEKNMSRYLDQIGQGSTFVVGKISHLIATYPIFDATFILDTRHTIREDTPQQAVPVSGPEPGVVAQDIDIDELARSGVLTQAILFLREEELALKQGSEELRLQLRQPHDAARTEDAGEAVPGGPLRPSRADQLRAEALPANWSLSELQPAKPSRWLKFLRRWGISKLLGLD